MDKLPAKKLHNRLGLVKHNLMVQNFIRQYLAIYWEALLQKSVNCAAEV
jgi:hypothetical protein